MSENATRDSWKTLPPGENFEEVPYSAEFDAAEFEAIQRGSIPDVMEDKWFVYYENDWLFLHRSWTGHLIYRVRFETTETGARVARAEVLRDESIYKGSTPDYESRMLDFLIRWLLLGQEVRFPMRPEDVDDDE